MRTTKKLLAVVLTIAMLVTMTCVCFTSASAATPAHINGSADVSRYYIVDPADAKDVANTHLCTSAATNAVDVEPVENYPGYTGTATEVYSTVIQNEARCGMIFNAAEGTDIPNDIDTNENAYTFTMNVYVSVACRPIIRFFPSSIDTHTSGSNIEYWRWQCNTKDLVAGWNTLTVNFKDIGDGARAVVDGLAYACIEIHSAAAATNGMTIAVADFFVERNDGAVEETVDASETIAIADPSYNLNVVGTGAFEALEDGSASIEGVVPASVGVGTWIARKDIPFNKAYDLSDYYTGSIDVFVPDGYTYSGTKERIRLQFGVSNTYTNSGIDSMMYNIFPSNLVAGQWNTVKFSLRLPQEANANYGASWWSAVTSLRIGYQTLDASSAGFGNGFSVKFKNLTFISDLFEMPDMYGKGTGGVSGAAGTPFYNQPAITFTDSGYAIFGDDVIHSIANIGMVMGKNYTLLDVDAGDVISLWVYQGTPGTVAEAFVELGSGATNHTSVGANTIRFFAGKNQTAYIADSSDFTGWQEFRYELPVNELTSFGGSGGGNELVTDRFVEQARYNVADDAAVTTEYLAYTLSTNQGLADYSALNYIRVIINKANPADTYYDGLRIIGKAGLTLDTTGVETSVDMGGSFDFSDLGVVLNYTDGSSVDLNNRTDTRLVNYTVDSSAINTSVPGEYDVVVTCEDVSETFTFTVVAPAARIGETAYASLDLAIAAAAEGDTIVLGADAVIATGHTLTSDLTIDLNGFNISAAEGVYNPFIVTGGTFTLTGEGTLSTTGANATYYEGIRVNGRTSGFAKAVVGEDVTITSALPVFIFGNGTAGSAVLDVYGTLIVDACFEDGDAYATIQGNGSAGRGGTIINVFEGASVTNIYTGGIYAPQDGTIYVAGTVFGAQTAIAAKSGTITIDGGALTSTAAASDVVENSNGIKTVGAAIQLESNTAYTGNMSLNIIDGTVSNANGYAIFDYVGSGTESALTSVSIQGGSFTGIVEFSEEFLATSEGFVTGGTFSADVTDYLAAGFDCYKDIATGLYNVCAQAEGIVEYEEDYARLSYTGNWSARTTAGKFSDDTAIRSYSSRASVVFSFSGTYLNVVSYSSATQGSAVLTIDGVDYTLDMSGATTYQVDNEIYLADGNHTVTITGNGDGWFYIDKIAANGELAPVPTVVDDTEFEYVGTWQTRGTYAFSDHSAQRSKVVGSTASYTFTGVSCELVTYTSPSYGTYNVYIDGELAATVDTCKPGYNYQTTGFVSEALENGEHTITVEVVSGWALVDALVIYQ